MRQEIISTGVINKWEKSSTQGYRDDCQKDGGHGRLARLSEYKKKFDGQNARQKILGRHRSGAHLRGIFENALR